MNQLFMKGINSRVLWGNALKEKVLSVLNNFFTWYVFEYRRKFILLFNSMQCSPKVLKTVVTNNIKYNDTGDGSDGGWVVVVRGWGARLRQGGHSAKHR